MSCKVYPAIKVEDDCTNYEVKINGVPIKLNTARVSAVPFNRRWPGHQRQINQTELVNFLSYEADESVTFEITPKEPFENVIIRPLSLGIKPQIADGKITFTLDKPAFVSVEPYGINNVLHIFGNPVSKYNIDFDAENVLYFGKGKHYVELIELKSGQTLFVDEGAVLYTRVHAIDAKNIKILGRGIIDNSKHHEEILFDVDDSPNSAMKRNAIRKHTINFEYCENIEIEGVTIRGSLLYNIKPVACENIHISNVKIIGSWKYNSDGINTVNCKNVLIENCFVRTFDDCICTKGFDFYTADDVDKAVFEASHRKGKVYDVAKDINVRNCVLWADYSGCLCIGAETKAEEMCNIVYEDCDILHFNCGAFDCFNIDYAHVHDIIYRNINVEYDDVILHPKGQKSDDDTYENTLGWTPYLIAVRTMYHHEYSAGGTRRGKTDNILFENIRMLGIHPPKVKVFGYDEEHKSKDITFKNFSRNGEPITEWNVFEFETGDNKPVTDWSKFDIALKEAFVENVKLEYEE